MRAIPSLHQQLLEATGVGICWVDARGTITFANTKAADLLGSTSDVLTGCPVDGVVQDATPIKALLAQTARGLMAHCEPVILRAGKAHALSLTAHPILDEQGNPTSTLVTLVRYVFPLDTEDVVASAEHFRALFESIDEGVVIMEVLFDDHGKAIDCKVLDINSAHEAKSGVGRDVVGKCISEYMPNIEQSLIDRLGQVALTGQPIRFEEFVSRLDSWFDAYHSRVGGSESRTVVSVFNNITERKRREQLQAFLLTLSDAVASLADPLEVQRIAANLLGEHLQVNHAHYGEVRGEYVHISHSYAYGLPPMVGSFHADDFGKRLMRGYRAGRLQVCVNTTSDPLFDDKERQVLAAAHIGAYIAVPLVKEGVWVATLSVQNIKPREWTPTEVEAVQEVAQRTWAAVARTRAERAMFRSEEKYRSLFESIDEGVSTMEVIFDVNDKPIDYRLLDINPAHEAMTGVGHDVLGKRIREFMPTIEQRVIDRVGQVALTSQPIRFEEFVSPMDSWFDAYLSRVGGSGSRTVVSVFKNITERRRREANLRFLAETSVDFAPLKGAEDIMHSIGSRLAQHLGLARCNFSVVDVDSDHIDCIYAWRRDDAMADLLGKHRISTFLNKSGCQHYAAGQLSVINDAQNHPLLNPLTLGLFDQLSLGSIVDVPYLKDGRWRFLLTIARSAAGKWREDEIELIREIAERTYLRIERARAEEALRESEDRLQALIKNFTGKQSL